MRPEVMEFVKTCDVYQKTKPANRKGILGQIPISGIFNTWSLDYAGSLPTTKNGNKYIINGVEHKSRRPVARVIPQSMLNSRGTMSFIEEEIIRPYSSPQYIRSDNDLKFDCLEIHDFKRRHDID